jgi:hypothetical protein
MKLIALLLLFLLTGSCSLQAQDFINMPYGKAEAALRKAYPGENKQPAVDSRKDSILVRVNSLSQLIFVFDEKGLCMTETINTRCDSCHDGYLKNILDKKKYSWKKINENQYISRYEDNLMIELFPEGDIRTISVLRAEFTRELYDLLLKG